MGRNQPALLISARSFRAGDRLLIIPRAMASPQNTLALDYEQALGLYEEARFVDVYRSSR
jgi:hypothetical protein